jgi:hypothetical protein
MLNMIKPFKYSFSVCYFIPRDHIHILEIGLPFCYGIKGSYIEHKDILDKFDGLEDSMYIGCIYIYMQRS